MAAVIVVALFVLGWAWVVVVAYEAVAWVVAELWRCWLKVDLWQGQ